MAAYAHADLKDPGYCTASFTEPNVRGELGVAWGIGKGTTEHFFTQWIFIDGASTLLGIFSTPNHSGAELFARLRCLLHNPKSNEYP